MGGRGLGSPKLYLGKKKERHVLGRSCPSTGLGFWRALKQGETGSRHVQ